MVNVHALTVSLEEFGLSKYEAQAYVSLIAKGTISCRRISLLFGNSYEQKFIQPLLKLENKETGNDIKEQTNNVYSNRT